jgi:hypothetical protein
LFLIALPAVAKSQAYAKGHDSEGRSHQDCDTSAYGLLPVLGRCRRRAVAHCATLGKGRERPEAENNDQQGSRLHRATHGMLFRNSHLTPNEIMRKASGKKTIIMARQKTKEVMVSHFMRDTSYFMCMK